MVDFLVQATLSNFFFAFILAIIAWVVQRSVRSVSLANLLWALVLIKLVTPPLFAIPVFAVPSFSRIDVPAARISHATTQSPSAEVSANGNLAFGNRTDIQQSGSSVPDAFGSNSALAMMIMLSVWGLVSAVLFLVSAIRMIRFHSILKANSEVDHSLSSGLSAETARQMGVQKRPDILVATANISPFVWWLNGRAIIVVSQQAFRQLDERDLRLVIAHEMAHIKRRDHWFRWLEWIALIGCWWNPVMWWARNHLRLSEEMACDQLVLETAKPELHQYASSLLNVAELLASSTIRPPVVASAINSGGQLEKRLKMIISKTNRQAPASLRIAIVAVAICVFPLGFVAAQDFGAVERRLGGAVEAGELSLEQAQQMMEVLRHSTKGSELEARKRKYMEGARKIKAAVEAGKVSKKDAETRLLEMRKAMFGESAERGNAELEAKKRRYEQVAREIKEAHEAGKISEEEAEEKLIALRREMFEVERHTGKEARELEAAKRGYEQAARDIKEAHEDGKISEEEAEEKLILLRREMLESDEN